MDEILPNRISVIRISRNTADLPFFSSRSGKKDRRANFHLRRDGRIWLYGTLQYMSLILYQDI